MFKQLYKRITGAERRELEAEAQRLKDELAAREQAQREAEAEAARLESERLANRSEKELANEKGEPWVNINRVTIDPANPGQGAFELDWNEFFVAKLIRAGYVGKDEEQIVDQWFQDVCRHVVLETYEQYEANYPQGMAVQKRDLGNGRTEIS